MKKFQCTRCGGVNFDQCLHCRGTGVISYSAMQSDRFSNLCETIAYFNVMRTKRQVDESEEGESWGFFAAENMMQEHDYTRARVWDELGRVESEMKNLSEDTLSTLCDLVGIKIPTCLDQLERKETDDDNHSDLPSHQGDTPTPSIPF